VYILVSYSVRGKEPIVVEALKARALPEGNHDYLLEFLRLYRDAVQMVVDRIGASTRSSPGRSYTGYSTTA
jgi:hypothetical protein